jgi:polysaccharide deacetylase 2 family uncharacterized protein YibQ
MQEVFYKFSKIFHKIFGLPFHSRTVLMDSQHQTASVARRIKRIIQV